MEASKVGYPNFGGSFASSQCQSFWIPKTYKRATKRSGSLCEQSSGFWRIMIFLQIIILVNNRTKKRGRHSNFTTLCSAATKAATISLDEDQRAVRLVRSIGSFD